MAGRPKNLTAWATGNYPAGANAWNGTTKRVANGGRYFEPKQLASPQEINDVLGELNDSYNALLDATAQGPALNWRTQDTTAHGIQHVTGAAYDQRFGRWAVFGFSTLVNGPTMATTVDGGVSWLSAGGLNAPSGSISNKTVGLIYRPDTGKCAVATYSGVTDCTTITDEETRYASLGTTTIVAGIWFNNLYIFAGNDSTFLLKTCPGGGVTTWTTRTASPAAGWTSCTQYYADTSGSKVMVVGGGNANYGAFILSSDGTAWTAGTITPAAGWSVVGACWASDRWVVAETNGADSKIYTSTNDGTSWTLASTLTGVRISGMNSIGALIFASTYTHSAIIGAYSTNGGVNWRLGGYYTYTPGAVGVPDQTVVSSGYSFAGFNATNKVNISNISGLIGTAFP